MVLQQVTVDAVTHRVAVWCTDTAAVLYFWVRVLRTGTNQNAQQHTSV